MESLAAIRQLPMRYGLYVDSRNMDALVDLFVPDVRVGRDQVGREALKRWYTETLRRPKTSIHLVANHIIDFDDADHAHGIVYCRDQLDRPDLGEWQIGDLQYWDTYVRVDGEWCFERRRFHRFHIGDALVRPSHGAGTADNQSSLTTHQLPEAFPTWAAFWAEAEA
jgi:hypothetical protein